MNQKIGLFSAEAFALATPMLSIQAISLPQRDLYSVRLGGPWAAEAAAGGEEEPGELGGNERIVFSLESFNVNLRGAGGGRVLRMEVQLEIRQKDEQHIQRAVPRLRDGVLTLASDYTFADLEGLDGKTRLRDEMHGRLNKLLDYGRIERVYFTEFVVQ